MEIRIFPLKQAIPQQNMLFWSHPACVRGGHKDSLAHQCLKVTGIKTLIPKDSSTTPTRKELSRFSHLAFYDLVRLFLFNQNEVLLSLPTLSISRHLSFGFGSSFWKFPGHIRLWLMHLPHFSLTSLSFLMGMIAMTLTMGEEWHRPFPPL